MMIINKHICIAFSLLILAFGANTALGCSCDLPLMNKSIKQQVADARTKSTAVFVGKVLTVELPGNSLSTIVTFEVQSVWRGPRTGKLTISTGRGGGDCGYIFEVGATYLVYAYGDGKTHLSTNICQRTAAYQNDLIDLKYLGKPILDRQVGNDPRGP